jgi:hypothetical protein
MTDFEELQVEISALRMLFEASLRREWEEKTNRNPQWPDNLRIYGLADIDRRFIQIP